MKARIEDRKTFIYGIHAGDGVLRYIGKTMQLPKYRLTQHVRQCHDYDRPYALWMREQAHLQIEVLEVVPSGQDWVEAECRWIAETPNLLNVAKGGQGGPGSKRTPEQAARNGMARRRGEWAECKVCGVQIWRKPYEVAHGKRITCSRSCHRRYQIGRSGPVPKHIQQKARIASASAARARTHCKRGHEYTDDNLAPSKQGKRVCRKCSRINLAEYRKRKKAARVSVPAFIGNMIGGQHGKA